MLRKISNFVLIFVLCFSCMYASASETVIITGNEVRFRSNPTTSGGTIYGLLFFGDELSLIDKNVGSGNGCNLTWFKVTSDNKTGYVCSEYARIKEVVPVIIEPENNGEEEETIITDYAKYYKDMGFPESYINSLVSLHNKHPNWKFDILKTNVSFNTMLWKEYDGNSYGWSLIEDTGRYYDGYKSTDSWSYNYLTNIYSNSFEGGGTFWFAANKQTISYYLDPRNFLNDSQIFMFESLSFNASYHTKNGVQGMLKGTFMENGLADVENNYTYADAFMEAGQINNVSPYTLVSRVIQEIGAQGSTITSGTVKDYEGYYNFYNIQAYGNSATETINRGLAYAKSQGWNTPYKAIVGGGSFLGDNYISAGQDTLYLQKWDVFGPNYAAHQYMQNIQAPVNEAIRPYNRYTSLGLINSEFLFKIPVYTNMPESTSLPNRGNPNNYLSSLSVNGDYLFESANTKTDYSLNLSGSTKSIDIAASKVASTSTVSGIGSISLIGDEQIIPIVVTAQNGDVRTYNITITRTSEEAIEIGEILRLAAIKNDGEYMFGFDLGSKIENILSNIVLSEPKALANCVDNNSNEKKEGFVASGDKIKIKTDKEEKEFIVIIYGDVNSDGKISASDYMMIKNHIMDIKKLSDYEKIFADANKDGKVTASDYMTIKNHIMEVKTIVQ